MTSLPELAPSTSVLAGISQARSSLANDAGRRVRTSFACSACKVRKVKCSGNGPPCASCARHGSECIYTPEADQRRREAARRTLEDLEYYRQIVHDLITILRIDGAARIDYLIGVVRATDSVEEIAMAVSRNLRREPEGPSTTGQPRGANEELEEPARALHDHRSKRRKVISIQSLTDKPLFDLPVKPWTNITDDEHFVSHLISLYFTWEHAAYHILDCEAFISDMRSGQLGAEACSPFLVNAVLAAACVFSDYPEACAVPGKMNTKGNQFFNEAKRLWEAEQGVNCLANVQGLCLMYLRCNQTGKDRVGRIYFQTALQMYSSLASSRQQVLSAHSFRHADPRTLRARLTVAWALHHLNTLVAHMQESSDTDDIRLMTMGMLKDMHFDKGHISRPYDVIVPGSNIGQMAWSPYPRQSESRMACLDVFFDEQLNLTEICADINRYFSAKARKEVDFALWQDAELAAEKLSEWHDHLPSTLEPRGGPSHFFNLQYNMALMRYGHGNCLPLSGHSTIAR